MKAKSLFLILYLIIHTFLWKGANAQCAMCKATVEKGESNKAALPERARGLNNGILYMMVVPYMLAGVIGYFWYRNSKKERERKNEIQRIIRSKMSPMQGGEDI